MFEKKIKKVIAKETKQKEKDIFLEKPKSKFGDYAFPCFSLGKKLKKDSKEIAKELGKKLEKKLPKIKVKVIGPYINFLINKEFFSTILLKKILEENFGKKNLRKKKTIVIDYSSPNIGKPMHVGHIRSTVIGDVLKRIYKFLGYKVIGINYLGDIGLHIGKLILAYEWWGDDKKISKDPEKELLKLYVKFCKKEKLSESQELLKSIEQEDSEKEGELTRKAKEIVKKIEEKDKKYLKLWKKIYDYSIKSFMKLYNLLNIQFEEITGQSKFSKLGKKIVEKALKRGIAFKGADGEIIVKLEKELPNKVVLRKDGTALYSTQDLGAAVYRFKKYKFDKMIYVVGSEQNLYFKQIFKILEKLNYKFNLIHVPFGLLSIEGEKISSRKGKVLFLLDVIKKAKKLALKEIKKRNPKLKRKEEIAEKIGIAALKFSILSREPIKDIKFSFKEALNFEGFSGPYLQYSYVRALHILKKSMKLQSKELMENKILPLEYDLIKLMSEFPDALERAEKELAPNIIAVYSYRLCQKFNEFYHVCPVIKSREREFRLKIVKAFIGTLRNCMNILNIPVLEKM